MAMTLEGPINRKRKKADLLEIAKALGINLSDSPTVNSLVASISDYLRQHPELSTQPEFQRLYVYRSSALPPAATEGHAIAKGAGKTSADKALEDQAEDGRKRRTEVTG